jgi:hypothetical protein
MTREVVFPKPLDTEADVQSFIQNLPLTPWRVNGTTIHAHSGAVVAICNDRHLSTILSLPDLAERLVRVQKYAEELEDYVEQLRDALGEVADLSEWLHKESESPADLFDCLRSTTKYAAKTLEIPKPQKPS